LARNLSEDAVSVYAERQIRLHAGDKIRFTANDHGAGVRNSQQAVVEKLHGNDITLRLGEDRTLELKLDSATMRKVDLAYAINAYTVQGLTTANGIVVMDSRDKMLASARNLHVPSPASPIPQRCLSTAQGIERAVGATRRQDLSPRRLSRAERIQPADQGRSRGSLAGRHEQRSAAARKSAGLSRRAQGTTAMSRKNQGTRAVSDTCPTTSSLPPDPTCARVHMWL
jgi:hypothetical protein